MVVVDTSIVVKWLVHEPDSPTAAALLDDPSELFIAPELLRAEFSNVIWKKVQAGALDDGLARQIAAELNSRIDRFFHMEELAPMALHIALSLRHPVYGCFYLALSEIQDCPFITTDQRLSRAVLNTPWAKRTRLLQAPR